MIIRFHLSLRNRIQKILYTEVEVYSLVASLLKSPVTEPTGHQAALALHLPRMEGELTDSSILTTTGRPGHWMEGFSNWVGGWGWEPRVPSQVVPPLLLGKFHDFHWLCLGSTEVLRQFWLSTIVMFFLVTIGCLP